VAGTAQVETATAAGTITTSGNATVTVTSTGMTGSPKAVSVAVLSGDTAAQWAEKVRTALAADAVIAARFTVGGTTTAISLTRKPLNTFTVDDTDYPFYPANDSSLNIALADGTSDGITEAATSANTTTGVATDGAIVFNEGLDFQGNSIDYISPQAVDIRSNSGAVVFADTGVFLIPLASGKRFCSDSGDMFELLETITSQTDPVDLEICIAGTLT
jgi:hypothetical protein